MRSDLQGCFRILDLEPGATLEDVKRSYRELVKVWRLDRFSHDPALQRKAQEKLKVINTAYERLRDARTSAGCHAELFLWCSMLATEAATATFGSPIESACLRQLHTVHSVVSLVFVEPKR